MNKQVTEYNMNRTGFIDRLIYRLKSGKELILNIVDFSVVDSPFYPGEEKQVFQYDCVLSVGEKNIEEKFYGSVYDYLMNKFPDEAGIKDILHCFIRDAASSIEYNSIDEWIEAFYGNSLTAKEAVKSVNAFHRDLALYNKFGMWLGICENEIIEICNELH